MSYIFKLFQLLVHLRQHVLVKPHCLVFVEDLPFHPGCSHHDDFSLFLKNFIMGVLGGELVSRSLLGPSLCALSALSFPRICAISSASGIQLSRKPQVSSPSEVPGPVFSLPCLYSSLLTFSPYLGAQLHRPLLMILMFSFLPG